MHTNTHTHVTTPGCVNAKCCCGLKHATCCFCISLSPFLSLSISFSLLCTHTLTMSDDMTQSLMKRYVGAPSAERAHLTHTHTHAQMKSHHIQIEKTGLPAADCWMRTCRKGIESHSVGGCVLPVFFDLCVTYFLFSSNETISPFDDFILGHLEISV